MMVSLRKVACMHAWNGRNKEKQDESVMEEERIDDNDDDEQRQQHFFKLFGTLPDELFPISQSFCINSSFFFLLSSSSHHLLLTLRILLITGHQNSNSTHLSQNTPYTCKMLMHLMCLFLHKEPLNSIYNFDVILKKKKVFKWKIFK